MPNFSWLNTDRQISDYVVTCAASALSVIDLNGSLVDNVKHSYTRLSTNGIFTSKELAIGGELLIDIGLVIEDDNYLRLSSLAKSLRDGEERHLRDVISVSAKRLLENESKFSGRADNLLFSPMNNIPSVQTISQAVLEKIGATGEEIVLLTIRNIFTEKNRPDLAILVKRVSLISDEFGYDIEVVTPNGTHMKLEVKSSVTMPREMLSFFITRHEASVSRDVKDWYLVFCFISDVDSAAGEVVGWIGSSALVGACPTDSAFSKWKLAEITKDVSVFNGDLAMLIWQS